MTDIRPEHPIGKTQWAKWGDKARLAYNHCIRLGFTFETAVAEGTAVQAKLVKNPEADIVVPAMSETEQDAECADRQTESEKPANATTTASVPTKKPRAPRTKKA